jgi:mono/diheme cytochrome c family protein
MRHLEIMCCVHGVMMSLLLATSTLAADDVKPFDAKIAPVLSAKCVACHQAGNAKGGFDLSTREGMLRGGDSDAALVPGKPDESPIYTRAIPHDGQKPEMPEKGEALTDEEAAALRKWIEQGAVWPEKFIVREKSKADASFWSLRPVAAVVPPDVGDVAENWSRHPIDRFVVVKLREKGLQPNSPADPHTFIRRATFDLWGLPPTPEEVAEFERDCQAARTTEDDPLPAAVVERLIERLLKSPHYGERWGRHWLDVIRFGESRGYERNEIITNLWPFRDYVIRSLNEDKPFDRFIHEHLAGDVIGKDVPDVEIGSAFLVAGPYDDVGNQDPAAAAQIRADQMDEMIRATSEAFLGLTMGCARCHDHKFDPLTQRDYHGFYATFAGTVHGPRVVSTAEARQQRVAQLQPLEQERDRLKSERMKLEADLAARAKQKESEAAKLWTRPRHSRYGTEETFEPHVAKFVRLAVEDSDNVETSSSFRIDEFEVWTDEATPRNVALASNGGMAEGASRDAKDFAGAYSAALTVDGKFGERWISPGPRHELLITLGEPTRIQRVLFSADRPQALGEDHPLTVGVGEYRIETSMDGKEWRAVASSADREPKVERLRNARLRKLVVTDEDNVRLTSLNQDLARVEKQIAEVPALPVWWVGNHRPITDAQHVFLGGNPQRRGEEALPASLAILSPLPSSYSQPASTDEGERRLALARWLTADDNPLTSRVLANRVWQYHFGTGLVDTPSDFGYMGSRPTHPELLDWLATELRRDGWKLKSLHRLIMTSRTYQQSGQWREEPARADADSRLLWRFPPRRLSAEEIRDSLLSIVGKLDTTMGGPGFKLYEYQQDNVATYVPLDQHGPETYRRAVYHHNARAARVDVLTDFDCPDPAFAEPRRAATTTPLQALTLMNHRFSLDMVTALAERLQREAPDSPQQVRRAFDLAFARSPSDAELDAATQLIAKHGLRAFCRALLNSNELIHVN